MKSPDAKDRLVEIIDSLPSSKLEVVLDFATYLKERANSEDFTWMQINSNAYDEWLGSENDVYDQVFHDELAEG